MAEKNDHGVNVDAPVDGHHHDVKRTNSLVISRARAATEKEQKMTLMEGIRTYPKAIGWSILISLCIAM